MSSYYDQLRSPYWQKKRLEILERDNFSCTYCGRDESLLDGDGEQLIVDHGYYDQTKKRAPWEYEVETLYTLCSRCNNMLRWARTGYHRAIAKRGPTHIVELYHILDGGMEVGPVSSGVSVEKMPEAPKPPNVDPNDCLTAGKLEKELKMEPGSLSLLARMGVLEPSFTQDRTNQTIRWFEPGYVLAKLGFLCESGRISDERPRVDKARAQSYLEMAKSVRIERG